MHPSVCGDDFISFFLTVIHCIYDRVTSRINEVTFVNFSGDTMVRTMIGTYERNQRTHSLIVKCKT